MTPFGLPKPPGLNESPFSVAGNLVKGTIGGINKLASDIDESMGVIDKELSQIGKPKGGSTDKDAETSTPDAVSDDSTYRFQLDLLIDNATDLETVHLPNKGRINGQSCDCIAKHARILRAHAKETIPIASRQGKDSRIFAEIATIADNLMQIGAKTAVESGKYDDIYLDQAGIMSTYRKKLENLLGQAHTSYATQCKDCPTTLNLKAFIEKRKATDAKKSAKAVQEAAANTEA
jgi:hypothetical protein